MTAPPGIVCIGEALVEFNEQPGGTFAAGFGGDTSNCAVAAARFGARAGYLSAVGADVFGDRLLAMWAGEGVDARHVARREGQPTGIYFVTHGPGGHAFTYYRAGSAASRMRPEDVPVGYVAGAEVLHASGISLAIGEPARSSAFRAMEVARENGVTVAFDTNLRLGLWPLDEARAVIGRAVALADVVLPGLDDAIALTGLDDPDAIADSYLGLGPSVVALTLGADGALVATADRRRRLPGHRVDAVDATAAGDTFDGAFLAMTIADVDPFEAARHANAAAALSTLGYGAVAPMPTRAAVEAFLRGA